MHIINVLHSLDWKTNSDAVGKDVDGMKCTRHMRELAFSLQQAILSVRSGEGALVLAAPAHSQHFSPERRAGNNPDVL